MGEPPSSQPLKDNEFWKGVFAVFGIMSTLVVYGVLQFVHLLRGIRLPGCTLASPQWGRRRSEVSKVTATPPQDTEIATLLKMSQLSSLYLFAYNSLQAFGWAISLSRILGDFVSTKSFNGAYASAGELICLLQTVALLEVIHGAIGIVPSGVLLPLMQWGGRVHFLLAIVRRIDEVQELPALFMAFVAWCLIEVIRYPHYALNCVGISPFFITYLRYTAFIVLYPLGLVAEIWLMCQALPFIKTKNLYEDSFAGLPFTYYNFVRVLLLCYPFMWLKLYLHLLKQRKSKLRKQHVKKKN